MMPDQDKDNYSFLAVWGLIGLCLAMLLGAYHLPFWPVIIWMATGWVLCVVRTMRKERRRNSYTLTYRI